MQVAHSIGWFTVSSFLGHYALLYGPQILLMMNIAYYLPSIPLLMFSAFCDEWLDKTFGTCPMPPLSPAQYLLLNASVVLLVTHRKAGLRRVTTHS